MNHKTNQQIDFRGTASVSLGIRNNNPGNIRPSKKYTWDGAVGVHPKDFVIFENLHYGVRALAVDLINKQKRGLDTVEKIISVYAPPEENQTRSYIDSVCASMGAWLRRVVTPTTKLDISMSVLIALIQAIIKHENGDKAAKIVSYEIITAGIALIPDHLFQTL